MKAGRNDPCPCGSGLKYNKCCLARDAERAMGADGDSATTGAGAPQGTMPPGKGDATGASRGSPGLSPYSIARIVEHEMNARRSKLGRKWGSRLHRLDDKWTISRERDLERALGHLERGLAAATKSEDRRVMLERQEELRRRAAE